MPLIRLDYMGGGEYECDKPSCYVNNEQTIEWECSEKVFFAVHLGWNWPEGEVTRHPDEKTGRITLSIGPEIPRGRYKYTFVVFDPNANKFFVEDPEFIVKG